MAEVPGGARGSGDVSRETVAPAPNPEACAQLVPPEQMVLLETYAGLLATEGVVRGLIGPREVPRLWDRHLINCALLAPLVPAAARVADLGSGAGLPGLVLAIVRPDLQLTLVESMARRVAFLEEACRELGLDGVEVIRSRAEEQAGLRSFDVVTARALAALPKLLGWGMPLVAEGGQLLAMKGSTASEEVEASEGHLRRWGSRAEIVTSSAPGSSTVTVVRVVRDGGSGIGWRTSSARPQRREGM